MRISDWSSDVCSSDLCDPKHLRCVQSRARTTAEDAPGSIADTVTNPAPINLRLCGTRREESRDSLRRRHDSTRHVFVVGEAAPARSPPHLPSNYTAWEVGRSEEHTSELQSLMRITY